MYLVFRFNMLNFTVLAYQRHSLSSGVQCSSASIAIHLVKLSVTVTVTVTVTAGANVPHESSPALLHLLQQP